jgi:low temperature requirement protein LtrA
VSAPPVDAPRRVTTLELFFDLVFVFTLTQLSAGLADDLSWAGAGRTALMLGVIFWMYDGYAWLTNAVAPERAAHRALLLAGMAGYLVLALAIPTAFDGAGVTFGLAYLVVVAVHAALFVHGSSGDVTAAIVRLLPSNLLTAGMILLGGALGGDAQYALWGAALAIEWASPLVTPPKGFDIAAGHFVERHGLVVIIAIGESIIAIGVGAAELAVDAELVLVAVVGLALCAALWWTYFSADDEAAEHALAAAPRARRGPLALQAFGYAHLVLLLGIVVMAVGLKKSTGHAFDELEDLEALALGGGVALFLLGDLWFRRVLAIGTQAVRAVAGLLALATFFLGTEVAALAQLVALVGVLVLVAVPQSQRA